MTSPTVSVHCRNAQLRLSNLIVLLCTTLNLAHDIGLAPFRIANIQAAITDIDHAWEQLNQVAAALELTGAAQKP